MATPGKQGKIMSSRLMTMKFMQRSSNSTPSTPDAPSEPPSKRQRLSNGPYHSSPSTPRSDAQAVREALAAEESKRMDAVEREAADRGETKWYLNFKEPPTSVKEAPIRIVSAGYSTLDTGIASRDPTVDEEDNVEVRRPQIQGRRSFGKFNKVVEKQQNPDLSSSGSDSEDLDDAPEEDDDGDESEDPTGAKTMIAQSRKEAGLKARAERKAQKKAEKAEAARLAEERRKKHVKLNNLTSISANSGGSPGGRDIVCHACGQKGHTKRDCPWASQQRPRRK